MSRWRRYHLEGPPQRLRRPGVRLDNLALVPASLLPFKEDYQAVANTLAPDEVLIVAPAGDTLSGAVLENVATLLRQKGHRVTLLPAEKYFR